jgi:hypothetical protein
MCMHRAEKKKNNNNNVRRKRSEDNFFDAMLTHTCQSGAVLMCVHKKLIYAAPMYAVIY